MIPFLSPQACLSREAASDEPCHSPPAPPPSSGCLTPAHRRRGQEQGLFGIPTDLLNPHLTQPEEWGDSYERGFSEPCSSCRGQEGRGRGTRCLFSDISIQFSLSEVVKFCKVSADTELVTTEPWLLGEIQDSVMVSLSTQHFHQLFIT